MTDQLKKLGLKPGNGDSYVQQVPLVEITAGKDARLSIAGRAGVASLELWQGHGRFGPSARCRAVSLAQSELVFAGYGIVAPEFDWNDYAAIDVRGKTVLVLAGDPGYRRQGSHGCSRAIP